MRPHLIRDSGGIWNHNSNEIQGLDSWFIRQQDWLFNLHVSKEKNKNKKEANLLDFFHLFFKMLENEWVFIFQLINKVILKKKTDLIFSEYDIWLPRTTPIIKFYES